MVNYFTARVNFIGNTIWVLSSLALRMELKLSISKMIKCGNILNTSRKKIVLLV